MRQFPIIFIILLSIFLLGMWGQYELSASGLVANPTQAAYNTLTLFVFEGEWTATEDLPWQLEVTRFVAPLVSVIGVLVILTQGAWINLVNRLVRFRTDHVVVAGLGSRSFQFVQSCEGHERLVIVEKDPDNPLIGVVRGMGMSVIVGDILAPGMFDRISLESARHLVAFTGSDGVNVELSIKARNFMQDHGRRQLLVHMHVDNTHIAERLENYPKFFANAEAAQVNFFSIYHLNARILFRTYPPEAFAHYFSQSQVHIALYHFGRQAEHILLEASRVCHFANGSRVAFTVFDDDADSKGRRFLANYPHLVGLADIAFVEAPVLANRSVEGIDFSRQRDISQHVVCLPSDAECLEVALALRATLLNQVASNCPILVRMQQSSGLAQLLESNVGAPEIPDGLYPFGMLDEVLHFENVLSDGLDLLARAFHESFLEERLNELKDADKNLYAALQSWNSIPEPERSSNRQAADHLDTKLRAIGCRIGEQVNAGFHFTDEEAELLARMEQNRWSAEKVSSGWRHGPVRIQSARINPLIGDFDHLPPQERERNVSAVRQLPDMLQQRLGKGIVRECRIGVSGHRLHKLNANDPELLANITEAFRTIKDRNDGAQFVLVSPLAEGADRLLATVAMQQFGMKLQVPIPLPYELYRNDFGSDASEEEFKELIGKAEVYFELPMRFGTRETLSLAADGSVNENRNKQYALAGAYCAQHCHEFIAIYDGEPAAGTGGTAQVVQWRESGEIEPEFQTSADLLLPVERRVPIIIHHKYEAPS